MTRKKVFSFFRNKFSSIIIKLTKYLSKNGSFSLAMPCHKNVISKQGWQLKKPSPPKNT